MRNMKQMMMRDEYSEKEIIMNIFIGETGMLTLWLYPWLKMH